MSKLESIVPPLELCKQIPAGEFEDSALVWRDCSCRGYYVSERFAGEASDCRGEQKFDYAGNVAPVIMKATLPAPALAEILAKLPFTDGSNRTPICCGRWVDDLSMWVVGYRNIDELRETDKNNPAAAALRLWLRIRREAGR